MEIFHDFVNTFSKLSAADLFNMGKVQVVTVLHGGTGQSYVYLANSFLCFTVKDNR